MWLEYNGRIYETMPGYSMYSELADNASRITPQLENDRFTAEQVGVVHSYLTDDQRSMIDDYHMLLDAGDPMEDDA